MKRMSVTRAVLVVVFFVLLPIKVKSSGTGGEQSAIKSATDTTLGRIRSDGYLVIKPGSSSRSYFHVGSEKIEFMPSDNLMNRLQGNVSGLTITGSGVPGAAPGVRIRGFSSLVDNNPLYVIDGIPSRDVSFLNPADVESVTVLKDASALAVYGSRASGGVISIMTKKDQHGAVLNYSTFTGLQLPGKGTSGRMLNSEEYANLQWLVYRNDLTSEYHPLYGSSSEVKPTLPGWAANTDWYDAITEPAIIANHDLTLSSRTENISVYAGLGYFSQDGIIIETGIKKYTARFNSEARFAGNRIRVGQTAALTFRNSHPVDNYSEKSPIATGPYRSQSIIPVKMTQQLTGISRVFMPGDWGGTAIASRLGNAPNTVALLDRNKNDQFHDLTFFGSGYIEVDILPGLMFRSSAGGSRSSGYSVDYTMKTYENAENIITSSLAESNYALSDWVWTNTLTYSIKSGVHDLDIVAGYEALRYGIGRTLYAKRSGYFSDDVDFRTLDNGAVIEAASSSVSTPTKNLSQFIRADYSFDGKYLAGLTIRRDGCSRFSKSDRFGVFPALSAGWLLTREQFMSSISWIDELKIRGSWGITGNQFAVSPLSQFMFFSSDASTSFYDLYGTFNSSSRGFYPVTVGNPSVKWEESKVLDLGIESSLFENQVSLVFDWYSKNNNDLLFNETLPGTAGGIEPIWINSASIKTTGIDLTVAYNKKFGRLGVNATAIISAYKSTIERISDSFGFFDDSNSPIGPLVRNMEGGPLSAFYGYRVAGIFASADDVNQAPYQSGAEPGFLRFENNDTLTYYDYLIGARKYYISAGDKVIIGDPNPDFTYGLNIDLTYGKLDLSAMFYGSSGNEIFNFNKWYTDFWCSYQGQKSHELLYDSWTSNNPTASVPKASNKSNFSTNTQVSSYYIENGSFMRLKSLRLGYHFERIPYLDGCSLYLYLQGSNVFTLTKYSGLEPEIGGTASAFGVDKGTYPLAKQFLFGLRLTFNQK